MTNLCIYHHNCADGFGAAWVVRRAANMGRLDATKFHPGKFYEPPPDVSGYDCVFIVDFSYKREVMKELLTKTDIVIIDHHKSAIEDLKDLPFTDSLLDINRSGAMLTWDYFFPDESPPKLIAHIQDRDLFKFDLPHTKAIQANLFSYPYDFNVWDELIYVPVESLIADGEAIERKKNKDVRELLQLTKRTMKIGGYIVPAANLPYTLSSEAGAIMAIEAPFSACYTDTPRGRQFSLRSSPEFPGWIDVSKIGEIYGGGGHQHAAGFSVSQEKAKEMEILEG